MNKAMLLRAALLASRFGVVFTAAAVFGGALALQLFTTDVRAQTVGERIARQESVAEFNSARIIELQEAVRRAESRAEDLQGQLRTMQGMGMGLGALIALGQVIQVFVGRELKRRAGE